MQNRIEVDISMVKKLIGVSLNKQEILKTEDSKYNRMLHETEPALNKAKTVGCLVSGLFVLSLNLSRTSTVSSLYHQLTAA
jgi:hypothetical protein